MSVLFFFVKIFFVCLAGFFITTKFIPFLFARFGRLLGFRMRFSKITEKRIARFKRIRRGYFAFVLLCSFFVISLFLELLVNDKALVICYDGRYGFPAVAQWFDRWTPFVTISSYNKKADFGLPGDEPVHYRKYAEYCENPELLKTLIGKLKKDFKDQEEYIETFGASDGGGDPVGVEMDRKILAGIKEELDFVKKSYDTFKAGRAWVVMPFYDHGPKEHLLDLPGKPPYPPSWLPYLKSAFTGGMLPEDSAERAERKILPVWRLPLGSTDSGLDVVPQLVYGFRISLIFALMVAAIGYTIGVIVGGLMGYYGGWTDILMQRVIEIYGSIPFLFTIMIIASIVQPGLILLAAIMIILRSWIGITYYVRGEFYREKAKDYVQSAIGTGVSDWKIITKHIVPNSLVPVVTFAPFGVVGYIVMLVSLDYLGFGLPPGDPSWGYLIQQGSLYLESYPHLIVIASLALAGTLFCVVVIGEAVREAFDPKVFSRLR